MGMQGDKNIPRNAIVLLAGAGHRVKRATHVFVFDFAGLLQGEILFHRHEIGLLDRLHGTNIPCPDSLGKYLDPADQ
jgi:hypothetical protein